MTPSPDDAVVVFSDQSLHILNACLGFIMYGIAIDLSPSDFWRLAQQPRAAFVGIASQFIVLPFLTWILVVVFHPHPGLALGMILVAACPGGNTSNFMTHLSKGDSALSITLTAFATISAIVMTPLNFAVWSSLVPDLSTETHHLVISPVDMAGIIMMIIAVPLILGMATARYLPKVARALRKPVRLTSMVIFAGFIIVALANNIGLFREHGSEVLMIVIVHNAVALGAGYFLARAFNLGESQARAITLETGLQNSGLGLVLIFNFFDGRGSMALVAACWGVWHLMSGAALAFFWSRRPLITKA